MGVFRTDKGTFFVQPSSTTEVQWRADFAAEMNDRFRRAAGKTAEHVAKVTDPYVPFLQGTLKNSVQTASDFENGEIVYNTPYARYQYYLHDLGHIYQGKRGPHWGERSVKDHKADIADTARRAVTEYGK